MSITKADSGRFPPSAKAGGLPTGQHGDIVELGKNAINQCQKDLPRSKHCDLVITAKVADKTAGVK